MPELLWQTRFIVCLELAVQFKGMLYLEAYYIPLIIILFGSWQRLRAFPLLSSIDLAGTAIPLSDILLTLGVTLDSKLTFRPHITNLSKSCFYHIRAIRHIRSALTKDMSQTIYSLLTCFI